MKEQQQFRQEEQSRERIREQQPARRGPELSARQWEQLLRRGESLTALPAPLLEELAEAVGNSALAELLRGGGEGPALHPHMPEEFGGGGEEPEVNHIRTQPPRLERFSPWERCPALPAVKPGGLRERG